MNIIFPYVKKAFAFVILLLVTQTITAQRITVSPKHVKVQGGASFTINYQMENLGQGNFIPPDLSDFRVLSGPNQYQSYQFINGKQTSSLRYSYTLSPKKIGKLALKGAGFQTRKGKTKAPTVPVTVSGKMPKQNPNAQNAPNRNTPNSINPTDTSVVSNLPDLFYRIEMDTDRVVMGQQATVSYVLYTVNNITNYTSLTTPNLQGYWVQDISPDRITPTTVTSGNKVFQRYVIKKYALFPQRTGELEIDPMDLEVSVRQISRNSRRSFFRNYSTVDKKVKCQARKLSVYPLPEKGKPDDFNGTVGNFRINVRPDRKQCQTNEGINLNIGVIGSGNLKLVEALEFDVPEAFEVYDPTVSENIYEQNGTVMGTKSFEYLLVPKEPGQHTIPPISFSYYNPATERYEIKTSKPIVLNVTADANAPTTAPKEKIVQDIKDLKTGKAALHSAFSSKIPLVLLGGLYLLPFLALPILISRKRKEDEEQGDVVGLKRRQALSVAQKKLEAAKLLMLQNKKKDFYNENIHAIWKYLEDRVNIPASELSKENISNVLTDRGVQESKCKKLTDIIAYCEMAIFAPVKDADNLQKTYDDTMTVIADIEEDLSKI